QPLGAAPPDPPRGGGAGCLLPPAARRCGRPARGGDPPAPVRGRRRRLGERPEGRSRPDRRRRAAFWGRGEAHEAGTDAGLIAVVLEGDDLSVWAAPDA